MARKIALVVLLVALIGVGVLVGLGRLPVSTLWIRLDRASEHFADGFQELRSEVRPLPVAFGEWPERREIQDVDWAGMAEALQRLNQLSLEALEREKHDVPQRLDFRERTARENIVLLQGLAPLIGLVPTHAVTGGELTHPIILANLMATVLEQSGLFLDLGQREQISAIGQRFETRYQKLQAGYGDLTLRLEKVVDELVLKRDAFGQIEEILAAAQRETLASPEIHSRLYMDSLSPVSMVALQAQLLFENSPEDVRGAIVETFSLMYGIEITQLRAIDHVFDEWYEELRPILEPVSRIYRPTLDEIVVAGQAHLHLVQKVLSELDLDESTRQKLHAATEWIVPRVSANPG